MARVNPYLPVSLQAAVRPVIGPAARAGASRSRRGPVGRAVGAIFGVVAVAGFTAALIVLLRMMLEVTSQGGFCARGGPYVIAHECSSRVALLTPLSIMSLLIFVGIGVAARGVGLLLAGLAWPALFCTLGGGFLYSTRFPQFGAATGYLLGGVFILMGGIPLLLLVVATVLRTLRRHRGARAEGGGEPSDGVPAAARHLSTVVLLVAGIAVGWYAALRLLDA